jgi:hypothetical protein
VTPDTPVLVDNKSVSHLLQFTLLPHASGNISASTS